MYLSVRLGIAKPLKTGFCGPLFPRISLYSEGEYLRIKEAGSSPVEPTLCAATQTNILRSHQKRPIDDVLLSRNFASSRKLMRSLLHASDVAGSRPLRKSAVLQEKHEDDKYP